jgi:trehalose 6-phosphate synthase/phosphatase
MFLTLPVRKWLVEGMLGADLIGFQTQRYRGHFTAILRRLFGLDMDGDAIRVPGRRTHLGVFPIGVDARDLGERAMARGVTAKVLELKSQMGRLIVGVDRLDYSKGIVRRLAAVERFLSDHPEMHGRVRMVQVAIPTRGAVGAYQEFRAEVEGAVGRINGRFGTAAWTPIQYLHRTVPDDLLLALYRAADIMLVTPLRDGMNLVAKEFVACRNDEDGVLILSEFAGAAEDLTDALIVNPYDAGGVADAMRQAFAMESAERHRRMRKLREQVLRNDVQGWTGAFLGALSSATLSPR